MLTRKSALKNVDSNFPISVSCWLGKYNTLDGSQIDTDCIDCAAGKHSSTIGSQTAADCIDCAVGEWSAELGAADIYTWYVVGVSGGNGASKRESNNVNIIIAKLHTHTH